jgi:hypothetical protein
VRQVGYLQELNQDGRSTKHKFHEIISAYKRDMPAIFSSREVFQLHQTIHSQFCVISLPRYKANSANTGMWG